MNKLGKLKNKVRHNYVMHTGGTSF